VGERFFLLVGHFEPDECILSRFEYSKHGDGVSCVGYDLELQQTQVYIINVF
jgi:hypothetical protein